MSLAAPGIPTPFVAGVVDLDGTSVRGNVINTEPDPDHVQTGMKLRLATYAVGTDDDGTEAIGFGLSPFLKETNQWLPTTSTSSAFT